MQINKQNLNALFTGYNTLFMEAYHGTPEGILSSLAFETSSSYAEEIYHWLGAFPGMQELIDEIRIENIAAHNYTVRNREFESTIGVKEADIERDSYGIYNPRFQIMGTVARQHDGEQLAELLANGFTRPCYTGKNFFDTDHEPRAGGTKFTNVLTKKLSQANFRKQRALLKQRKNAAGRVMGLGRDLVLLTTPSNEDLAREILLAERSANGQTNVDRGTARIEISAEIGAINEDFWAIVDAGQPIKPLIKQREKDIALLALDDPEDDHVFKKHEFLYQAYKRMGYGYGLPEVITASDGSTSA